MPSVVLFILGLAVGSFLNALAYRIKNDRPFIIGRSFCPHCKKTLLWWHLIPVVSFLILRGKCYFCKKPISFHYPLIELLTALSFFLTVWVRPSLLENLTVLSLTLVSLSILVFIVLYDWQKFLILDAAVIAGAATAFILAYLKGELVISMAAAGLLTVIFAAIYYVSKGAWLGFGDVKLAFFLGLLNGPLTFLMLILASWLGSLVGLAMMASGRGTLKTKLPFGLFLGLASMATLILEAPLISFLNRLWM